MIALTIGLVTAMIGMAAVQASTTGAGADETPFYCNLKALSSAERTEHQAMTTRVLESIRQIREIADGYAFDLDIHQVGLKDIAAWVAFEQRCCPFFDFRVEWRRENGPLTLQLAGREGVKEFIRAEFKPAFK